MTGGGALLGVDNIGQIPLAHCVAAPALVPITQPLCKHLSALKAEVQEPLVAAGFQSRITKSSSHALDPHIHLPESHKELGLPPAAGA